jgi:hypothetical protein
MDQRIFNSTKYILHITILFHQIMLYRCTTVFPFFASLNFPHESLFLVFGTDKLEFYVHCSLILSKLESAHDDSSNLQLHFYGAYL